MTIGNINAFAEETVEVGQAYGYTPYGYGGGCVHSGNFVFFRNMLI